MSQAGFSIQLGAHPSFNGPSLLPEECRSVETNLTTLRNLRFERYHPSSLLKKVVASCGCPYLGRWKEYVLTDSTLHEEGLEGQVSRRASETLPYPSSDLGQINYQMQRTRLKQVTLKKSSVCITVNDESCWQHGETSCGVERDYIRCSCKQN